MTPTTRDTRGQRLVEHLDTSLAGPAAALHLAVVALVLAVITVALMCASPVVWNPHAASSRQSLVHVAGTALVILGGSSSVVVAFCAAWAAVDHIKAGRRGWPAMIVALLTPAVFVVAAGAVVLPGFGAFLD